MKHIIANWKMNGSVAFAEELLTNLKPDFKLSKHNIIICPPFLLIPKVISLLKDTQVQVGAQTCHHEVSGAFTGEVSPLMLQDQGCKFVILGHSERRQYFHESDAQIQRKAKAAQSAGLTPIICVGEPVVVRDHGKAIAFVLHQLSESLPMSNQPVMVAYEPIWAIGTGLIPSLKDIEDMHQAIRQFLKDPAIPLLYGGSVTNKNAQEILSIPNVDGLLIGGASLKADQFREIVS